MDKLQNNVPRVRFKGYQIGWEQKLISDVFSIRNENSNASLFSVDIELENMVSNMGIIVGNTSIRTKSKSTFRKNDILFGKLRPYLNKWWLSDCEGVKSGEIWALYTIPSKFDCLFSYCLIQTFNFLNVVHLTTGTKMPRADWSLVKEHVISTPQLKEQTQIGNFFQKLDKLIELSQARLEQSKTYKKAMLQKMFPQQGETVPQIRFKGFSGDWDNFSLENIGYSFNGLSGKRKSDFGKGSPFITYQDIFSNAVIKHFNRCGLVQIGNQESQFKLCKGDVFFTTSSETADEVALSSTLLVDPIEDTYLNSFCFGVRFHDKNELNINFSAYLFRQPKSRKQLVSLAQGSTRFNISKTKLMRLVFQKPSLNEQTKIGNFFQKLDQNIEQQTRKLEHYQQLKKAMLQRMFV